MQKNHQILQSGWGAALAVACFGFYQSPTAVAWLLATVACITPLVISLFLNGPQWDRSFFGIAVISLNVVAITVGLGQWAVLATSPVWVPILPFASLILWIVHESKPTTEKQ